MRSMPLACVLAVVVMATGALAPPANAQSEKKPNIVIIWGDDIGQIRPQRLLERPDGLPHAEHRPRRRTKAMMFTDYYAEQSCTAGRSAFITGQSVFRTGLSKVGIPGRRPRPAQAKTPPSPSC